jgi:hypothetical protein
MTFGDVHQLIAQGIPIQAITAVCPAPTSIRLVDKAGERYEPDPDGRPAWIFPATVVDPAWPELLEDLEPRDVVACGPIVDLVAFSPHAPRHWALRIGQALALGAIEPQWDRFPLPVPVHRRVVSWLRSGCCGIMLLTRDPHESSRVLRGIEVIQAEDKDHAAELRRLLYTPSPTHSTVVARSAVAA